MNYLFLSLPVEIENLREGHSLVEFDPLQRVVVKVESFHLHGENVGEMLELESLSRVAFLAAFLAKVLVVSVQSFRRHESFQGLLNARVRRRRPERTE